mmetsp:Transcript_30010/g.58899  ORF Transcript_30010/g.58899 Transcript_30010/m.58899 type:complete len:518 (+) Transcript_30010:163-1716(+)
MSWGDLEGNCVLLVCKFSDISSVRSLLFSHSAFFSLLFPAALNSRPCVEALTNSLSNSRHPDRGSPIGNDERPVEPSKEEGEGRCKKREVETARLVLTDLLNEHLGSAFVATCLEALSPELLFIAASETPRHILKAQAAVMEHTLSLPQSVQSVTWGKNVQHDARGVWMDSVFDLGRFAAAWVLRASSTDRFRQGAQRRWREGRGCGLFREALLRLCRKREVPLVQHALAFAQNTSNHLEIYDVWQEGFVEWPKVPRKRSALEFLLEDFLDDHWLPLLVETSTREDSSCGVSPPSSEREGVKNENGRETNTGQLECSVKICRESSERKDTPQSSSAFHSDPPHSNGRENESERDSARREAKCTGSENCVHMEEGPSGDRMKIPMSPQETPTHTHPAPKAEAEMPADDSARSAVSRWALRRDEREQNCSRESPSNFAPLPLSISSTSYSSSSSHTANAHPSPVEFKPSYQSNSIGSSLSKLQSNSRAPSTMEGASSKVGGEGEGEGRFSRQFERRRFK